MEYLYHGSWISGLTVLNPKSYCHNYPNEKVVYLTANRAYSLFYIWDAQHNNRNNKYVTCGLKDGVVQYHEQFPNQLYSFYNGVSGYIYSVIKDETFIKGSESDMWINKNPVPVRKIEFIPNVYDEILKYEQAGKVEIRRYHSLSVEDKNRFIDMTVNYITDKKLMLSPNSEESKFISKHFVEAWKKTTLIK